MEKILCTYVNTLTDNTQIYHFLADEKDVFEVLNEYEPEEYNIKLQDLLKTIKEDDRYNTIISLIKFIQENNISINEEVLFELNRY